MTYLSFSAHLQTGDADFDSGISDLMVVPGGTGIDLFAVSGAVEGGLTQYPIGADGLAATPRTYVQGMSGVSGVGPQMMLTGDPATPLLWLSGTGPGAVHSYGFQDDGSLAPPVAVSGIAAGSPGLPLIAAVADRVVLGAPRLDGVTVYTRTGTALGNPVPVPDSDTSFLAGPVAIGTATVGAASFAIVASPPERGISVIDIGAGVPHVTDAFSSAGAVALMQPTALASAEVDGTTYVIAGSMPQTGGSGALTSFALTGTGRIGVADHVLDTRDTRFGQVQAVEAASIGDRVYVAAAGGDDGLSLFALAPDGRLLHLESIADSTETGLGGVTAMAFDAGAELALYVASESEPGVSRFVVEGAADGVTDYGTAGVDRIAGGNDGDWLFGQEGDDAIAGGGGNDLISDGSGADQLSGGSGGDVFYLSYDQAADMITDFDPAQDRIDLSDWRHAQDPSELTMVANGTGGMTILYREEVLTLIPAEGVTLDEETVRDAVLFDGARLWEPPPDLCPWIRPDGEVVLLQPLTLPGPGLFGSDFLFGLPDFPPPQGPRFGEGHVDLPWEGEGHPGAWGDDADPEAFGQMRDWADPGGGTDPDAPDFGVLNVLLEHSGLLI